MDRRKFCGESQLTDIAMKRKALSCAQQALRASRAGQNPAFQQRHFR
jgi:hypothetical protein